MAGVCQLTGDCRGGSNLLSRSPGGSVIICDHPADSVCEQDFGNLCPVGWSLCSRTQFINRNAGWTYVPAQRVLGTIHCRNSGGAGHFTFGWSGGSAAMSFAEPMNCAFGSSRNTCTATYGCNEQSAFAMCCAPTSTCGNGVVDSPEELCDDGNQSNDDACLTNCTWRAPAANGVSGTSC
jgi:cysteine-rich repeat protein